MKLRIVLLALAAVTSAAQAQEDRPGAGRIAGVVVDSASGRPLAMVQVDAQPRPGPGATARATTRPDGSFALVNLPPATYRVRVRAMGFTPRILDAVRVGPDAPPVRLDTIRLRAAVVQLQSVVVSGAHAEEANLAPDRNTYSVRDMPATRCGSALDVLRNVPSVDVDIDNTVSLRGDEGVVVQINGRPTPMKAEQLGNFLAQLPADMVSKVEVVTNPSARDNPEGSAGILNIVLEKDVDAGTSGGLSVTGGTTGRVQLGGNVGYQRGRITASGSYGFFRDERSRYEDVDRTNHYTDSLTYLDEAQTRTQLPLAHTVTGSLAWEMGARDALTGDLLYSTRSETGTNSIVYRDLDASRALTGLSDRTSRGSSHESNLESSLQYDHRFAAAGHKLSARGRLFHGREGGPDEFVTRELALDGTPSGTPARETQTGWEHPEEYTGQVDYALPLGARARLETGYRGTLQRFHTTLDTRVFGATGGAFVPDTARSSDFTFDQRVHAGYAMATAQLGHFALQAGLRAEHAATRFALPGESAYASGYNSVFPSGLVAYDVDPVHQVKLSYSTRIWRPDNPYRLDPTPRYADPLNLSRGNPRLRPAYIRSLELGFQRTTDRATVQLTPFYRHVMNSVRRIRTIDTAGVTTTTFANVATTDAYGTDLTLALRGGRVTGFMGASAYFRESHAGSELPGLAARTVGWTARTNTTVHLTRAVDLQALLYYRAPQTVEQGRTSAHARVNLAARAKLLDDRVSLTLRAVDPFDTSRERFTTIDPQFVQLSERGRRVRGLLLGVSWSFGHPPEVRDDRGDGVGERDRGDDR